ncbi:MAG: 50S ribosomal protein L18 [Thermoplasmata archaeon]|nr:50S ribosomal protein L18 [Thermoplasmata archaeon]
MAKGPRFHVQFRRRRKGKTDYRQRKNLLMSGLPRAIVRCSSNNTFVQFADFKPEGDVIIASASTKELQKMGWKHHTGNTPAAYLAGYLAAKRAKLGKVDKAVLDLGLRTPTKGSKVFAALKGMLDAGMDIPHSEEVLPPEERIQGAHIDEKVQKSFETIVNRIKEGKDGV